MLKEKEELECEPPWTMPRQYNVLPLCRWLAGEAWERGEPIQHTLPLPALRLRDRYFKILARTLVFTTS